jgi:type IV pilus assembly protein PilQ
MRQEAVAVPSAAGRTAPGAPGNVSFNFKEADLLEILSTFSLRYGVTIEAGPEIRGKVTVRVENVPWETALKQVLQSCNYTFVKRDGVYRVVSLTEPSPLPAALAAKEVTPAAGEQPPKEAPPTAPGRVTFDFKDTDLVNILRIFSVRYGVNIVAGPEVQGKVTIRLVDVPWETALKLILESNNYSYVKQQNVIRVLSREKLDKEPLETRVFPLSYAKATEVVNSITHLLTPQRGQVKPDDRSNTLVVTDTPAKLSEISEIIDRLDRRTPQVLIEARILELKDDFDENIGINWVSLKGFDVTFGPPEGEGLYSLKREEVTTKEDKTERTYKDRDIYRKESQKGVGTMGSEDSFGTTEDTGTTGQTTTTISSVPGTNSGTTVITTSQTPQRVEENLSGRIFEDYYKAEGLDARDNKITTTELTQAILTPDAFQLTLSFLQEQTDANLISHPKIVTADNIQSSIKVAEQWPIPKFQFNQDTGTFEVNDFEYKDIGIILNVKPHVNEDDFINMSVTPEVSNILSFTTFGGAVGAQLPIISTRTAKTDVLIRNGQTLAIGGLMREDESDLVNKVPLLGEIPLLGPYVFSNSSKTIRNTNVLIFVTANVVTEDNKESLWLGQREDHDRKLNLPRQKWWEPKKLRHGLGSQAGY